MTDRPVVKFQPGLESLEAKQLMSTGLAPVESSQGTTPSVVETGNVHHAARLHASAAGSNKSYENKYRKIALTHGADPKPTHGYLVFRVTNPNIYNNHFNPPFQQVMVQSKKPIPGQTYNILFFSLRNGTAQTFDANSGFMVKMSKQTKATPILTGDMTWKPGETFVFYVLTKKYYPIDNQVTGGFIFDLGGARSLAIPGPSGIFQRIQYNPNTFSQMLGSIVVNGPGNQGGQGIKFGMPNTSITEFVNAKTNRNDFGGYF
jgi:hypothetical protein